MYSQKNDLDLNYNHMISEVIGNIFGANQMEVFKNDYIPLNQNGVYSCAF